MDSIDALFDTLEEKVEQEFQTYDKAKHSQVTARLARIEALMERARPKGPMLPFQMPNGMVVWEECCSVLGYSSSEEEDSIEEKRTPGEIARLTGKEIVPPVSVDNWDDDEKEIKSALDNLMKTGGELVDFIPFDDDWSSAPALLPREEVEKRVRALEDEYTNPINQ